MNNWAVGNTEKLTFKGTAVHGGGSCQIAVTTDKEPTKDSKWKVIHSIEGGCPGAGGPEEFPFEVPSELPNGQMTAAWTWFNKIGNREMYMNCAPITVTGGSDDKAAFESLPDMALANINFGEGTSCKTKEAQADYTFENPGKYTTRKGPGPFVPLCGGAPASGQPAPGVAPGGPPDGSPDGSPSSSTVGAPGGAPTSSPGGAPPAPEQPDSCDLSSAAPAPSAPPSQTPSAPTNSAPEVVTSTSRTIVTVTATGSIPSNSAPSKSAAPTSQSPAASGSAAPPKPTGAPAAPGGGPNDCPTDGEILCNGESQFGICNHGKVVWQPVAAGTKCSAGAIVKRDYTHRNQRTAYSRY
jgi:hypothetical protein